jgi:hypothetical protein
MCVIKIHAFTSMEQLPIDSPPSSPFRSVSYAAFVQDKELLQAKADVEECFRQSQESRA